MRSYKVRIQTEDAGKFLVIVKAENLKEAEAIACQSVRHQFSHSITEFFAFPANA